MLSFFLCPLFVCIEIYDTWCITCEGNVRSSAPLWLLQAKGATSDSVTSKQQILWRHKIIKVQYTTFGLYFYSLYLTHKMFLFNCTQFSLVCPLVINFHWCAFICLTCKTSRYTNPITTKLLWFIAAAVYNYGVRAFLLPNQIPLQVCKKEKCSSVCLLSVVLLERKCDECLKVEPHLEKFNKTHKKS